MLLDVFKRSDERIVAVLCDDVTVFPLVQIAVLLYKSVIDLVQLRALGLNRGFVRAVHLQLQQSAPCVAQLQRGGQHLHLLLRRGVRAGVILVFHKAAVGFLAEDLPVAHDVLFLLPLRALPGLLLDLLHAGGVHHRGEVRLDRSKRLFDLLCQLAGLRIDGHFVAPAVHRALRSCAEHHFRMAFEILVVPIICTAFFCPCVIRILEVFSAIRCAGRALLQHKDVRHNLCARVSLKRRVRQTDRADKICAFCDFLSHARRNGVARVHRAGARDDAHRAAGLQKVKRADDEIVVNPGFDVLRVIGVRNRIVAERHVADNEIQAVVRNDCLLKAHRAHVCIRIEQRRDPRGHWVKLYHRDGIRSAAQGLRHSADEVAGAGRRLQDAAALHAVGKQAVIHSAYDLDARVVRVHRGFARRSIFFLGEKRFQLLLLLCPLRPGIKHTGETAPSDKL